MTRRAPILLVLLQLGWAAPALAQTAEASEADVARQEYDAGRALFAEGRFAEACPKLEKSLALAPELRTRFGLGDCYEKLGRLASAWREFQAVAKEAAAAGNAEQQSFAEGRARALEPRLIRLSLSVSPKSRDLPGFELLQNGTRVERDAWGKAVPVDPGTYRIEAIATGRRRWSRDVTLSTEGSTPGVEVPALEPVATTPAEAPARRAAPPPKNPPRPRPAQSSGSSQRVAGVVVGAAGVATLGAGVVVGLLAKSRFDDSADHCTGNYCDAEGLKLRDQAYDRGTVATVLSIAGGALAAGGVVLYLTSPSPSEPGVSVGASVGTARVRLCW